MVSASLLVLALVAVTVIVDASIQKPSQNNQNTAAAQPICISQRLIACQAAFNANLGVDPAIADWTNPSLLIHIIQLFYRQSIDGLLKVCNARQQFSACLGDQYDACMSQTRFIRDGVTPDNAFTYVSTFKTIEFDCDGGFIQSAQHWGCIINIITTKTDAFSACYNDYNAGMKTDYCGASANYTTCMRMPFQETCGTETSWWECERVRRAFDMDDQCPQVSCDNVFAPRPAAVDDVSLFFSQHAGQFNVLRQLAQKAQETASVPTQ